MKNSPCQKFNINNSFYNFRGIGKFDQKKILQHLASKTPGLEDFATKKAQSAGLLASGYFCAVKVGMGIAKRKSSLVLGVPGALRETFRTAEKKQGKEYINAIYNGFKEYLSLEGFAPLKVDFTASSDKGVGSYNFIDNILTYCEDFIENTDNRSKIGLLSHEVFHCHQINRIIRTQDFGIEAIADAYSDNLLRELLNSSRTPQGMTYLEKFQKKYSKEDLIKMLKKDKQKIYDELLKALEENHKKALNLPKIPCDSVEAQNVSSYIEALKNYHPKNGSDNFLETEARDFGEKMVKYYDKFILNS